MFVVTVYKLEYISTILFFVNTILFYVRKQGVHKINGTASSAVNVVFYVAQYIRTLLMENMSPYTLFSGLLGAIAQL